MNHYPDPGQRRGARRLKTENERLEAQNAALAERIARIEAQLQRLLVTPH